jgi:uncharacterized protein
MEDDEGDRGPDRVAVARMCIVTRVVRPVSSMIRFVAGPDGAVVPDIRVRLPGRGVWLTNARPVLAQAIKRQLFKRALKADVTVPAGLEDQVADLLRRDALQMLALANKAGAVTSGFAKIEGMRGPLAVLVQASDGSAAEIARLQGLCRAKGRGRREPPVIRAFTALEIALSLGREHVIHAALTVHDAASVFMERGQRFVEFQAVSPAKPDPVSASGLSGFPESPLQVDALPGEAEAGRRDDNGKPGIEP